MNDQQIDSLLVYLKTIQIEPVDCAEGEEPIAETVTIGDNDPVPTICPSGHIGPTRSRTRSTAAASESVESGEYDSYGEALFNLELSSGAYSCARCHTQGWSYDQPGVPGQGALGWNITGSSENAHFPDDAGPRRLRLHRVRARRRLRPPGAGQRADARLRSDAHRRADLRHRRLRAGACRCSHCSPSDWEPELRGLLTVIIGVVVFMGSIYLRADHQPRRSPRLPRHARRTRRLDGADGCRLADLRHRAEGTRTDRGKPVPGRTVLQDPEALVRAGVLEIAGRDSPRTPHPARSPTIISSPVRGRGLDTARRVRLGLRSGRRRGRRARRGDRGVRRR